MSCLQLFFRRTKRRRSYAPSAISLSPDRHNTDHCNRPTNSHQGDPNGLSSLSRESSMVVQQDNTRHQPRSTSSSIKPHRRLHRNTRTPNVSLHFEHTYLSTHISADNQYTPASKTADLTKTAPHSIVGQLLRSLKPSTNIDFLPLFHIKHRLKSHISTPLTPSALPHDRRHQTTKHIGQCKHASIVLPRSILRRFTYSAPLSL